MYLEIFTADFTTRKNTPQTTHVHSRKDAAATMLYKNYHSNLHHTELVRLKPTNKNHHIHKYQTKLCEM